MNVLRFFLWILLCVMRVNLMALKGPPLTKYVPCSLGVIYFDKLTDRVWKGTVQLGLYNIKTAAILEMEFENDIIAHGPFASTTPVTSKHFLIKLNGTIPYRYEFLVGIRDNSTFVPTVKKFTLNNYVMCDDGIKALQTIESLDVTKEEDVYSHICGRRAINQAELSTVGTETNPGDWPWHVAIFHTPPLKYQCGGSIISRTAVVTAGHCVRKAGTTLESFNIVIVAGVNQRSYDVVQQGRQEYYAEKVILHPSYDDRYATADLAVIKVNKIRYTEYVQPVCLWGPVYEKSELFGKQAMVVGFGAKEDNKPSEFLRAAYTLVQNDTTCLNYDRNLYSFLLNEFTFCAGFGPTAGINPRNGDSGGGLVLPINQADHKISWVLRGVLSKCGVSKGETSCDPRFYTVYTDVGPHYGWMYHHSGLQFSSNILTTI